MTDRITRGSAETRASAGTSPEPEKPIQLLKPKVLKLFAAKTRVSIDKATRLLGYKPAFGFDAGMELTQQWARWANYL